MKALFLPSLINLVVPLLVVSFQLRGQMVVPPPRVEQDSFQTRLFERNLTFFLGLGILVMVPAFKTITHLPPFMGILFGLGILWTVGELVHRARKTTKRLTLAHALTRIDMSAIVFFIGILLAVATLEHAHILEKLAKWCRLQCRAPGHHRGDAGSAQRHCG